MKTIWILIVVLAGAFLPIQAGLNTKMGRALDSPIYASMISFVTGAVSLIVYIALTKQNVNWHGIRSVPAYVWLSGALGAFYVTSVILAFPRLGSALTFGLVVGGQMLIALFLDHLNILVTQQHSINIWRIIGVLFIVGGVILIRIF